MRRDNQKNKDYVVKWSHGFTYAIGLLTTDGNLSKDGRHFDFTSKDIQLIRTFKVCLNLDCKISTKTNGHSDRKYYRVQFSNIRLYKYLLRIGLIPNKTKKIREIKVPKKYFFDFLRGHFDGDRSCFSFWDKRWPNSFMFYTYFTSSNLPHLEWLQNQINKLLNTTGSINKSTRIWQLQYTKKDSQKLWKRMYYKKNLPCLLRKRKKVEKILKIQAQVA